MKLNLMKRLTPFLTTNMKKLYYNSYVLTQFDYCCTVWAKGTKSCLNKVFKIQKRAARILLQKPNETPSMPLFNHLGWLTFENRYKFHSGVLVYKALNNQAPPYISKLFISTSICKYSLRSSTRGDISSFTKIPNTKYMQNTFSNTGKEIWNCIPVHIRQATSVNCFKYLLKKHLLHLQTLTI